MSQLLEGVVIKGKINFNLPGSTAVITTKTFFDHPQIKMLKKNLDDLPSYVPAANFTLAMMDLVSKRAPAGTTGAIFSQFQAGLKTFATSNGEVVTILQNLADTSKDIQELQKKIEDWYNGYMDRVTGWYKSHSVTTTRLIAIGVTLFFNINIIKLTKQIHNDTNLRNSLMKIADNIVDNPDLVMKFYKQSFDSVDKHIAVKYQLELDSAKINNQPTEAIYKKMDAEKADSARDYTARNRHAADSLIRQLSETKLSLGYHYFPKFWEDLYDKDKEKTGWDIFGSVCMVLFGWFISAGCLSMGAPFWFQILVQFINIRRAGVKPEVEKKKDN